LHAAGQNVMPPPSRYPRRVSSSAS
jgi:hypothetical protein